MDSIAEDYWSPLTTVKTDLGEYGRRVRTLMLAVESLLEDDVPWLRCCPKFTGEQKDAVLRVMEDATVAGILKLSQEARSIVQDIANHVRSQPPAASNNNQAGPSNAGGSSSAPIAAEQAVNNNADEKNESYWPNVKKWLDKRPEVVCIVCSSNLSIPGIPPSGNTAPGGAGSGDDETEEGYILPVCHHIVGLNCLDQWIEAEKDKTEGVKCPVCRVPLDAAVTTAVKNKVRGNKDKQKGPAVALQPAAAAREPVAVNNGGDGGGRAAGDGLALALLREEVGFDDGVHEQPAGVMDGDLGAPFHHQLEMIQQFRDHGHVGVYPHHGGHDNDDMMDDDSEGEWQTWEDFERLGQDQPVQPGELGGGGGGGHDVQVNMVMLPQGGNNGHARARRGYRSPEDMEIREMDRREREGRRLLGIGVPRYDDDEKDSTATHHMILKCLGVLGAAWLLLGIDGLGILGASSLISLIMSLSRPFRVPA